MNVSDTTLLVKVEVARIVKQRCEFYVKVPDKMPFSSIQALAYNTYAFNLGDNDAFDIVSTDIESVNLTIPKP